MWIFNLIFGKIFEFIFLPFRNMNPWVGMILISFLTALFLLFIFRWTSNQKGIKQVKDKIKAHLLELRLFKDNLRLSFKSQANILRYNLKYIGYSIKPLLIMIIPLILILTQLNLWFGYDSLSPGQKFILKVKLKDNYPPSNIDISINTSPGLETETMPLRVKEEGEVDWRLSAAEKGFHDVMVNVNGKIVTKEVAVGQKPLIKISPLKTRPSFIQEILNPGEPPIPANLPIKTIEVSYPSHHMNLFGLQIHWIIIYFALSIIFGFAFKGVFKVEI